MNKDLLLAELQSKVNSGEITANEIVTRLGLNTASQGAIAAQPKEEKKQISINKILYVIGAVIVFAGLSIFIGQIWEGIGTVGRIAVTLGTGLAFAFAGTVLLKSKPEQSVGQIFHSIGGLLIPGGAVVALTEFNVSSNLTWPLALTFGFIFLFYIMLTYVNRNVVLTLFAVANGTGFIYLLTNAILDSSIYSNGDVYAYLTMIIGASYLMLAHQFKGGWNDKLVESLYMLGTIGILGAAYTRIFNSVPWQMFYFLLIVGGLYLSIWVKNRNILVLSTIFLIMHVSYITGKYFADSLGWPVSLIVLGFLFILFGYLSVNINKTYISKKA